jgi:putative restriction endonuclease
VTTDHHLEVSGRVREDYGNGRSYCPLHGSALRLPSAEWDRPRAEFIRWHNENVYLG